MLPFQARMSRKRRRGSTSPLEERCFDQEAIHVCRERGIALLIARKPEKSRAIFEGLLAMGDRSAAVYFVAAAACLEMGDDEKALEHFFLGFEIADPVKEATLMQSALQWAMPLLQTLASER